MMELIVIWTLEVAVAVVLANYKRRSVSAWVIWTLFFGPFAILVLLFLSNPQKQSDRILRGYLRGRSAALRKRNVRF